MAKCNQLTPDPMKGYGLEATLEWPWPGGQIYVLDLIAIGLGSEHVGFGLKV